MLLSYDIIAYSPLRGKRHILLGRGVIDSSKQQYNHPLTSAKGVLTRDHFDVLRSDMLLANLLGAEVISVGTVMEIAWAFDHLIPIVLIMEDTNVHNHIMLCEAASYIVPQLDQAFEIIKAVLLP